MSFPIYLFVGITLRYFTEDGGECTPPPPHPMIFFEKPPIKTNAPPIWGALLPIKNGVLPQLKNKPSIEK